MSIGFITGCTQQSENNEEPDHTPVKYSEFVNWSVNTSKVIYGQLSVLERYWENESWDECLSRISYYKSQISTFVNKALVYNLQGTLDLARSEFIKWLNTITQVYEDWELALHNFIAGDNQTGNGYAQSGQTLLDNAQEYAKNCGEYITEWLNEE